MNCILFRVFKYLRAKIVFSAAIIWMTRISMTTKFEVVCGAQLAHCVLIRCKLIITGLTKVLLAFQNVMYLYMKCLIRITFLF
jgi:hypothetical protein